MMSQFKKVKKHKRLDPLHDIETLKKLAKQASRRAIKQAGQAGVSAVYIKDGVLVKRAPDNSISEIKRMDEKPRLTLENFVCQA